MSLASPSYSDEFRQSMGQSFDEFVVSCVFNQKNCRNRSSWVWFFDGYYGNCWRLNTGSDQNGTQTESYVSTKAGKWTGLDLM
jgi:hypothetical protein